MDVKSTINNVSASEDRVSVGPRRILVHTKTQHVPGDEYHERLNLMQNIICQHVWSRNFDPKQDRFHAYRALFNVENRTCYFLVDHGHTEDDNVPISRYRWNGATIEPYQQNSPPELLKRLQRYPFNGMTRPLAGINKDVDDSTKRLMIRERIRMNMKLPDVDIEFLKRNPDAIQWLLNNTDRRLWPKIPSL